MTNNPSISAAVAYLRYVMQETNWSASALAKNSGISSSTLTRVLNNKDHKFTPSLTTLGKVAKASGIDPGPFLSASNYAEANLVPFTKNILDASWGDGNDNSEDLDMVVVIGEAAVGEWKEFGIVPFNYAVPVLGGGNGKECFALVAKGKSCDLVATDGQILYCIATSALGKEGPHRHPIAAMFYPFGRGALLAIERRSDDHHLIEISARHPIWTGSAWHFVAPSSDPRLRTPIIRPDLKSDEHFKILGQCSWVLGHTHMDDALMQKMQLT